MNWPRNCFSLFAIAAMPMTSLGASYCGQQAVVEVLERFGVHADLVDIARETALPGKEGVATLAALQRSLATRGIPSVAVSVSDFNRLPLDKPAIVHCLVDSGDGHYLVAERDQSGRIWVWDGATGEHRGLPKRCRPSGVVLLTGFDDVTKVSLIHPSPPLSIYALIIAVPILFVTVFKLQRINFFPRPSI